MWEVLTNNICINISYQDHPHVCGKYRTGWLKYNGSWGSPPRMWEVPKGDSKITKMFRITPTYVGSTIK